MGVSSVLGQVWVVPEPVGLQPSRCCQYRYFHKCRGWLIAELWSEPWRCLFPKFTFFSALTRQQSPGRSPALPPVGPEAFTCLVGPRVPTTRCVSGNPVPRLENGGERKE